MSVLTNMCWKVNTTSIWICLLFCETSIQIQNWLRLINSKHCKSFFYPHFSTSGWFMTNLFIFNHQNDLMSLNPLPRPCHCCTAIIWSAISVDIFLSSRRGGHSDDLKELWSKHKLSRASVYMQRSGLLQLKSHGSPENSPSRGINKRREDFGKTNWGHIRPPFVIKKEEGTSVVKSHNDSVFKNLHVMWMF